MGLMKTNHFMLCREIITVCTDVHTNTYMHCMGRIQNCLMLNLVVHKVTTKSQRTEIRNMLIYHDPGIVHAPKACFSFYSVHSQKDVPITIIIIVCISNLLYNWCQVSNWLRCVFDHPPPI